MPVSLIVEAPALKGRRLAMACNPDLDRKFMNKALQEAHRAFREGEVPVGALVVEEGQIIGRGRNATGKRSLPTAHAEIRALEAAARHRGDWRLNGTTLYVTLEPCPMCAGAMLMARVDRLVYSVSDPRWGCAGTLVDLLDAPGFPHRLKTSSGLLADESRELMERFFRSCRDGEMAESG